MYNTANKHHADIAARRNRQYERLIGTLINYDLIDVKACERRAIYGHVESLQWRGYGRCHAMALTAVKFCCSYQKVRNIIYDMEHSKTNHNIMDSTIRIKNDVDSTTIDIEGTIGLSEEWQFDNPDSRVATYERFRERVSQIADISNSVIVVNIRSTGGDVNDALLIYEALRATGAHITTRCYGYTASAATIVAQAASEGCREVAPSTLYLIHNSLCSTEGNADELQAEVEMLRETDSRLAEIYASRSGRSVEQIAALMAENGGRGRWLSPAEAIAEGLVDRVISDTPAPDSPTLVERTKQGVKALLRAIGIEGVDEAPSPETDVNYIPREPNRDTHPVASVAPSIVALDEGQRGVAPTAVKSVEDPSPVEAPVNMRDKAYAEDARAMRYR
jgi:ATP-dependent protease ClpP protease subunit